MSLHDPTLRATTKEGGKSPVVSTEIAALASLSWRTTLVPWWQAILAILPTFLASRVFFGLLTYFGGVLFSVPNYWIESLSIRDVIYTWYRWDAIRYMTIAARGYIEMEYSAFFPLYPAIVRAISSVTRLDILATGMLVSNLAFLGAMAVFYRLVESEFDRATAKRAVLYLAIFPTALFFFAAYNESLFLLFLFLSFYYLRRGSWWLAGLSGGLATLTRSIGIFLAVIFLCEFLRQYWPQFSRFRQYKEYKQILLFFRPMLNLIALLFIPLGLALYSHALLLHFGDPLAFSHAQVNWREGMTFPWVAPLRAFSSLFSNSLFTFTSAHIIIDLSALILFTVLLILTMFGPWRFNKNQWPFIVFGLMALLYSVVFPGIPGPNGVPYDPIPSMQRFVLEIFAGFILLARLGQSPRFHQIYIFIALPLLTFLVLQFLTGYWTI